MTENKTGIPVRSMTTLQHDAARSYNVNKIIWLAIACLYFYYLVYAIIIERHFYDDMAWYFLKILETQDFNQYDSYRQYAQYLNQSVLIAMIKLFHVTDIKLLSYSLGLGQYLSQLACLVICYYVVRNINVYYMMFPLIQIFGINLNMSFIMSSEIHILTCIFWPIMFYLVLKPTYNYIDIVVVAVLSSIFVRCYPIAFIYGSFILIYLIMNRRRIFYDCCGKIIGTVITISMTSAIAVSFCEIIKPRDGANMKNFVGSLLGFVGNYPAMVCLLAITVLLLSLFLREKGNGQRSFYLLCFASVCFSLAIIQVVVMPELLRPEQQYITRSYVAYSLPLLSVIAYLVFSKRIQLNEESTHYIRVLVPLIVFGQLLVNIYATSQWSGFKKIVQEELNEHNGLIMYEKSELAKNSKGSQLIRQMSSWGWNIPSLSILWSDNYQVQTIISARKHSAFNDWQPFQPHLMSQLPDLVRYGVTYEKYRQTISKAQ